MSRRLVAAFALVAGLAAPAAAHDFWIEPSTHRRETAGPVSFALRVGAGFEGDAVPRDPARFERFVVVGPLGERAVAGRDGDDPAGLMRLEEDGIHVVAYRSTPRKITLDAIRFEAYLAEEGLEAISAWRREHGEGAKDGVEAYSRAVKTFVRVGPDTRPGVGFDRAFGFPFELTPVRDPLATVAGESLEVRVEVDGKPVAGVRVGAMRKHDDRDATTARSDARGRVTLKLDRAGRWLVHAVHMRRAAQGAATDWESVWASLTFEVPGS